MAFADFDFKHKASKARDVTLDPGYCQGFGAVKLSKFSRHTIHEINYEIALQLLDSRHSR